MLCFSLEAPQWGASNEYLQHMFSWRNEHIYLDNSVFIVEMEL